MTRRDVQAVQRGLATALVVLVGCGRIDFAASSPPTDTRAILDDASPADSDALPDLLLQVGFDGTLADSVAQRMPECVGCPLTFAPSPSGLGLAGRYTRNECLEFADEPALRPATLTLMAWIRIEIVRITSVLGKAVNAAASSENSYEFWLDNGELLLFATESVGDTLLVAGSIGIGPWRHVAGTFDGTTKRLYVNGVEIMSKPGEPIVYDAEPLRVGCDRAFGAITLFFEGELDDVRLYGRALSAAEIAAVAAAPP